MSRWKKKIIGFLILGFFIFFFFLSVFPHFTGNKNKRFFNCKFTIIFGIKFALKLMEISVFCNSGLISTENALSSDIHQSIIKSYSFQGADSNSIKLGWLDPCIIYLSPPLDHLTAPTHVISGSTCII